jgi:chromosome segregation ATPase
MEICQNCIEFKKDIDVLNTKIICMEYENEDLKQEIKDLKHEIKNVKDVNKELTQKINIIEYENKELKKEIKELKNENIQLKFNNFKNKLLTAIQDINKNDNLEKKYNYLHKIRKYRNNNNHYINEEFDTEQNIINYKKLLLKNKLSQLNKDEIELFNKRYNINNLVNIILDYLNTLNLNYDNLDEDDKNDADNWWLD